MSALKGCQIDSVHDHAVSTTSFETSVPLSSPSALTLDPHEPPIAPSLDINSSVSSTHELSINAKIGIGIGIAGLFLIIITLVFGLSYFKNRQRAQAMQRAIDEVERGTEMQRTVRHGSDTTGEDKENMVLESRIEIVVGDDHSENDVIASWDGWNATWDVNDELERGRKGMSLPRRGY
jgi:hypothetical protein